MLAVAAHDAHFRRMGGGVDRISQGRQIAARRVALGIESHAEFSRLSGLARATIASAEAGTASPTTYARLDLWLSEQEGDPHGIEIPQPVTSPEDEHISFEVSGPRTEWHVKVSGPPEMADALRRQVVELLREWQPAQAPEPD